MDEAQIARIIGISAASLWIVMPELHMLSGKASTSAFRTKIWRRKTMTHQINGFAIQPSNSTRHLFRRMTEPSHEYIFEITSRRILLRTTLPND